MKQCMKCKLFKATTEFTMNRHLASGLSDYCKSCKSEIERDYRAKPENRARLTAYHKEWRARKRQLKQQTEE